VLIAYGVLIIGLADNILRPILVGRDTKLPDWMVLLSTLGGIVMVGINGFVVGPLIAVLFVAFWQIFMREFHPQRPADASSDSVTPAEPD
jgi:predicted PurR-regulated permease PerM